MSALPCAGFWKDLLFPSGAEFFLLVGGCWTLKNLQASLPPGKMVLGRRSGFLVGFGQFSGAFAAVSLSGFHYHSVVKTDFLHASVRCPALPANSNGRSVCRAVQGRG